MQLMSLYLLKPSRLWSNDGDVLLDNTYVCDEQLFCSSCNIQVKVAIHVHNTCAKYIGKTFIRIHPHIFLRFSYVGVTPVIVIVKHSYMWIVQLRSTYQNTLLFIPRAHSRYCS